MRPVDPAASVALLGRLPDIKAVWAELLRQEPALNPLGRPDTLIFLMDQTLRDLAAQMNTLPSPKPGAIVAPPHRHCRCGLNPLLKYFATGELALRAAAAPALGPDFEATLLVFQRLAWHEINSLCSVCQLAQRPECALRLVSGATR